MKYIIFFSFLAAFLIGIVVGLYALKPINQAKPEEYNMLSTQYDSYFNNYVHFKTENRHLMIFLNNLYVGLILVIGGYFTFGLLPWLILFWNGFILSIAIKQVSLLMYDEFLLYSFLIHGPIEIFAFILFSDIGLNGFRILKNILRKGNNIMIYPNFYQLSLAILLLGISAIIEGSL